ncbi:MAG: hypothetical protein NTU44_16670 [Bacteroidetes bacterium]|nr:hypothetical protein [Bacteroidota bacterium]
MLQKFQFHIILILLFLPVLTSQAQIWPKIFNFSPGSYGLDVDEYIDKSYIITGKIINGSSSIMGIILKSDVNGNVLWYRKVGNLSYKTGFSDSFLTQDNGIISTGTTAKYDLLGDVFILKSNACGEKEWCKIYNVPNDVDVGVFLVQLLNGNYLILVSCFGYDIVNERVWLFYLNQNGSTIWQKVYCQNDPKMKNQFPNHLIVTTDGSFLVSGMTDYEDTLVPNLFWLEPLLIKIDQNGNEIWAKPWTYNTNSFTGYAIKSEESNNGNIYSSGVRYNVNPGNFIAPSIIKSNSMGNPLEHH